MYSCVEFPAYVQLYCISCKCNCIAYPANVMVHCIFDKVCWLACVYHMQIGFSNESTDDRRSVQHGIIVSKAADRSGFIRGSSSGNPGASGGGCFAVAGGDLLAISVANERVPIHDSTPLYELGARHAARSILVPVDLMTFLASS